MKPSKVEIIGLCALSTWSISMQLLMLPIVLKKYMETPEIEGFISNVAGTKAFSISFLVLSNGGLVLGTLVLLYGAVTQLRPRVCALGALALCCCAAYFRLVCFLMSRILA